MNFNLEDNLPKAGYISITVP